MPFDPDQFVSDCLAALGDGHDALAVEELIARAVDDPTSIVRALGEPPDQPLFSTWYRSDELTILNIIWPPQVDLLPHDHLMWASIGLYGGREDNALFRELPDGALEQRGVKRLETGDTVVLGERAIHSVVNPTQRWTGALLSLIHI